MHGVDRADRAFTARVEDYLANREHAVRILVGKRLEKHGVDQGEDGRICTDADAERNNGDGAEAGILTDPPKGIAQILTDGIEDGKPALLAIAFLRRFDAAKREPGTAIGFLWGHTAPHVFVSEQLDMGTEFLGEIGLGIAVGEASEQLIPGPTKHANHAFDPLRAIKRATISVACAHCVTSEVSCFWPAL